MRILHTSDWHVGKTIRGMSRLPEHEAVLAEIRDVAAREDVDLVLVAGDVFESASPGPDAARVAYRALLDLAADGRRVVVVGGNHDSQAGFEALRPLFAAAGVVVLGQPAGPADGAVLTVPTRGGETARIALLPFPSQRYVVKADALLGQEARDNVATYAETVRRMVAALTAGSGDGAVNLLVAHLMVRGGTLGGGERDAQTIFEYAVDPAAFPAHLHYVALGHLHRPQAVGGTVPAWYSGSPLQLDFGETNDEKAVLLVEATPSTPAVVRPVPLRSSRRLRLVRGTMAELAALAGTFGDDFLRVVVREPRRVGLADEVRDLLGDTVVDVRVDDEAAPPGRNRTAGGRTARTHRELFEAFLTERGVADPRLVTLFDDLLDAVTGAPATENV